MPTELDEDATRAPLDAVRGDVAFEDVWFEYDAEQPVLRGVSFVAPAGTYDGAGRFERASRAR